MTSVLIVGCGVMGLSTALELARNGYSVTAIDAYPVPSPWSAANDYNKIIRTEYLDLCYTKMSLEAMQRWRSDKMFEETYNECGRLLITPESHAGRKEFEEVGIANLKRLGHGNTIEYLRGKQDLQDRFGFFQQNSVSDTTEVKWNPESGLAHAANSLKAVYEEAVNLGVKFHFGDSGHAVSIEKSGNIVSVVSKDGSKYTAGKIILSLGASTGSLVDLKEQQAATGLFVTHIRLSEQEFEQYKRMPIVFDSKMGYFFPPDPATRILKICLPGSGASNFVTDPFNSSKSKSLPRFKTQNPEDTMPVHGTEQAKRILKQYTPDLAYHRLFDHKACWIADTSDSHFIIDKVPGCDLLYVASGDSGHAFKFLPNIGQYIRQRLEDKLDMELAYLWRWKDNATAFNAAECSWRVVDKVVDFSDIQFIDESEQFDSKL